MKMNDKETAGIMSKHEAESPSNKGDWSRAVSEQEKNMMVEVPSKVMPNRSKIRQYKGK